MEDSKIEWTHHTFNHTIGCTKVSAGCKNCYAEADMDNRRKRVKWGPNGTRSVTSYAYWRQALKWNKDAKEAGERRRVFCASLADIFEDWQGEIINSNNETLYWVDRDVLSLSGLHQQFIDVDGIPSFARSTKRIDNTFRPLHLNDIREMLFWLIESTPYLDWLLLTKRPENIRDMIPSRWRRSLPDNVWIGTSVEDQAMADLRIPELLSIPAKVRFLSMEPLLGNVTLEKWLPHSHDEYPHQAICSICGVQTNALHHPQSQSLIDWVIVGGESGHNARPMHKNWVELIQNQCEQSDIAFFFKQWGEFRNQISLEDGISIDKDPDLWINNDAEILKDEQQALEADGTWTGLYRLGKKKAGRLIDSKSYDAIPK